MLDKLTIDLFTPVIGQKFKVTIPDGTQVDFILEDAEELPVGRRRRNAPELRRKPFSLFFTGPGPLLPQAMYPMQHEVLGDEPAHIFIVPLAEVDGGYEYEAVFT